MREDVNGKKLEVGDVIIRPVFSYLYKHLIVGKTKSGFYLSKKVENNFYRDGRFNIKEHNIKMYINNSDITDVLIVDHVNDIPKLPTRKQLEKLNKEKFYNEKGQICMV